MNDAATQPTKGTLYLVPAPLDFGCDEQMPLTQVLPDGTLRTAARLTHWICENAKSTRAYLKRIDALHALAQPLQAQQITELPREAHKKGDHGDKGAAVFDAKPLLAPCCWATTWDWSARPECPPWPTPAAPSCAPRMIWAYGSCP